MDYATFVKLHGGKSTAALAAAWKARFGGGAAPAAGGLAGAGPFKAIDAGVPPGTFLDLEGDDEYHAARYGQGASAHYGVGMLLDYQGTDQYRSTGPYYNMGVSWDHGVSLAIDGGTGDDLYAFDASTGLGKANHMGWAIFVDEGGHDRYTSQSGFGEGAEGSLAGFFDLAGSDAYSILAATPVQLSNSLTVPRNPGGFFVDR